MTARTDVGAARPLSGRVIVVTRARSQAGRFGALLEEAGARVLAVPTIAIEPPASWAPLDAALAAAGSYHWLIFTSANGVAMVRRRLGEAGRGAEALGGPRVVAIGPATAEALRRWGLGPELVPDEYVAEGLVARLRDLVRPGERVLLPRAAETRDLLVRELAAMGASVDEVAAYRTRPAMEGAAELMAALEAGGVDVVTFTSSSTVRHFAALFAAGQLVRLMASVLVACIGPVTAATAAEHGLRVAIAPEEYTIPALARAIAAHYSAAHAPAPLPGRPGAPGGPDPLASGQHADRHAGDERN
ncbi:MAG: uroporphyrinogen-III synthase [Candidatus Rokubacteria bacterium]|nr:uroporphyrinogen-III synthase [Candidatus Rokubacteria bacterium]